MKPKGKGSLVGVMLLMMIYVMDSEVVIAGHLVGSKPSGELSIENGVANKWEMSRDSQPVGLPGPGPFQRTPFNFHSARDRFSSHVALESHGYGVALGFGNDMKTQLVALQFGVL
jgi:hypothetical protein